HYYKELNHGFTDAEFQQTCETVAGVSLTSIFEYVYITKELDYNSYLSYAGLKIDSETNAQTGKRKFMITRVDKMSSEQMAILQNWLGK
ncbi:MAG: M61 family peptidase, partial [Saprospiraceae bacterium]